MRKNQGFAIMELVIVILVVAIVVALGVIGYGRWKDANTTQTANTSGQQATMTPAAPQVQSTQDLDTASKALDQSTVSSSSVDQLTSQSSSF